MWKGNEWSTFDMTLYTVIESAIIYTMTYVLIRFGLSSELY